MTDNAEYRDRMTVDYVLLPTTKEGLARHIEDMHPEHVYPKGPQLRKWSRDEIAGSHAELHNGDDWHTHDPNKNDLMGALEKSLRRVTNGRTEAP